MEPLLGADYIDSFLTTHNKLDYAREPIFYPRTHYWREHTDEQIKQGYKLFRNQQTKLKPCTPSLLEYHLRASTKNPFAEPNARRTGYVGPRWILTSYRDDSLVNFIQVDIDRHSDDDSRATEQVHALIKASARYGFYITWTTSPGYRLPDLSIRHGLYAWIRLDTSHMVFDLKPAVLNFLTSIGLSDIAQKQEGAYLKKKKLVRLPGQYNVELADPISCEKLFIHSPVEASKAFQASWREAEPLPAEVLFSLPLNPPELPTVAYTHSSVTPSPLPTSGDTFDQLLMWGRAIVNQHFPDSTKLQTAIDQLTETAKEQLPASSRTGQSFNLLRSKAEGVVRYLWSHTDANIKKESSQDEEDRRRFSPHAEHIRAHRAELVSRLKERDREAGEKILDLLIAHNGRVAAVELYHQDGESPICRAYREWTRIRDSLGLCTLDEYSKDYPTLRGKCRQYGLQEVFPL